MSVFYLQCRVALTAASTPKSAQSAHAAIPGQPTGPPCYKPATSSGRAVVLPNLAAAQEPSRSYGGRDRSNTLKTSLKTQPCCCGATHPRAEGLAWRAGAAICPRSHAGVSARAWPMQIRPFWRSRTAGAFPGRLAHTAAQPSRSPASGRRHKGRPVDALAPVAALRWKTVVGRPAGVLEPGSAWARQASRRVSQRGRLPQPRVDGPEILLRRFREQRDDAMAQQTPQRGSQTGCSHVVTQDVQQLPASPPGNGLGVKAAAEPQSHWSPPRPFISTREPLARAVSAMGNPMAPPFGKSGKSW